MTWTGRMVGDGSLKLKMFDLVDKLDRLFPVPNTVPRGVDDLVLRGPKKPSKWFMCSWNYLHVIQSLLHYLIANIIY